MTPSIDGKVHHFEWAGLDNGLSLLRDFETGTIWHHITGEALVGPLLGERLPMYNLLQTTVEGALANDPDLAVAISDRPIVRHEKSLIDRVPGLGGMIRRTMAREDDRRPQMEIGLGVWNDDQQRYYPMDEVREADGLLIDEFGGKRIVVYVDPRSRGLASLFTEAESAEWNGKEIQLSDGSSIRDGTLYEESGERVDVERPLQLFTRWYGFALTFPKTTIYEP